MHSLPKPVVFLTLAFAACHLLLALSVPAFDDETYYALWASEPFIAYFDHPPMIAWFIALGNLVFGHSLLGLRAMCVVVMALSTLMIYDTARTIGLRALQAIAASLFFNVNILVFALGGFATPDVPSSFFWIASTWAAVHAVKSGTINWWLLAGVALGLGVLSKLTNAFLCIGLLGWLLATKDGRLMWRSGKPYLALLAFTLTIAPFVLWNAQNEWIGLFYQFGRVTSTGWNLGFLGEYVLLLLIAPTPLIAYHALKGLRAGLPLQDLLLWTLAPLLVYFCYHATHSQVQANWIVPFQGTIAIFAGAVVGTKAMKIASWLGGALTLVLVALVINPFQPMGVANNPPNQTKGWSPLEAQVRDVIDAHQIKWIATETYGLTGQFYFRFNDIPVYGVTMPERYFFRDTPPLVVCSQSSALYVGLSGSSTNPSEHFDTVIPIGTVERRQSEYLLAEYDMFVVVSPKALIGC